MKDTRKNLSLIALGIVLMALGVEAATPLADYFFNWVVWALAMSSMAGCWYVGGWGILFDDDDGQMIADCNALFSGSQVTFPVEYAE